MLPDEIAEGLLALARIDTFLRVAGVVLFAWGLVMVGIHLYTKR